MAPYPATLINHKTVVCGLLPDAIQPNSHNPTTKASLNTTITNMGLSPLLQCVESAAPQKVVTPADSDHANILKYISTVVDTTAKKPTIVMLDKHFDQLFPLKKSIMLVAHTTGAIRQT